MEPPRDNPRLLNLMLVVYVLAAIAATLLIAYGAWNAPRLDLPASPGGAAVATTLAEQRGQQYVYLQVGIIVAFAWLGGLLLLRVRDSYLASLRQIRTLREEVLELSQKDPLTGIGNRRAMPQALSRICAQADREAKPLAFAVLEVDKMWELNQSQSYQAGDTCLMALAADLHGCARRPLDLTTRLGGDMFLVCWYDTTGEHALELSQNLLTKFSTLPFKLADGSPMTLSIGLARRPAGSEMGWEKILHQAEDAMRHAKSVGGNQIAGA